MSAQSYLRIAIIVNPCSRVPNDTDLQICSIASIEAVGEDSGIPQWWGMEVHEVGIDFVTDRDIPEGINVSAARMCRTFLVIRPHA